MVHIATERKMLLAQTKYRLWRHDKAAAIIHWKCTSRFRQTSDWSILSQTLLCLKSNQECELSPGRSI